MTSSRSSLNLHAIRHSIDLRTNDQVLDLSYNFSDEQLEIINEEWTNICGQPIQALSDEDKAYLQSLWTNIGKGDEIVPVVEDVSISTGLILYAS